MDNKKTIQGEHMIQLEKPFTDTKNNYTVTNTDTEDTFEIINLETGGRYYTNPITETCTCNDFKYRTNNGKCKHIRYLQEHPTIKKLIEKQLQFTQASNLYKNQITDPTNNSITHQNWESPFSIMERKDEDQILAEMKGNVIQEFVYSFNTNGKEITGLSYAGVKQIALEMGGIHCSEPILQEHDGSWICKVKAVDVHRNLEMWGVSIQSKLFRTRYGKEIPDDFAVQKAVSKAERNALRKLMPERLIIEMIKEWKQNNNGRGNAK